MGHVEDEMTGEYDGTTMGQLIAMEVASSRSEALLKLLGAVEDFTKNQFQNMEEELEKREEKERRMKRIRGKTESKKVERKPLGKKKLMVRLKYKTNITAPPKSGRNPDDDGKRHSDDAEEDTQMKASENGGDLCDREEMNESSSDTLAVKRRKTTHMKRDGEGKAYIDTAHHVDSEVVDADLEADGMVDYGRTWYPGY